MCKRNRRDVGEHLEVGVGNVLGKNFLNCDTVRKQVNMFEGQCDSPVEPICYQSL